ncbi:uncharacterized protein BDR25DRAFT_308219 [Lindgomyces ingoldianus]|uniref:Uncharacterized protein n=1 Tax=Lindgomyces ingoldianus TaxID=673940 RepID=A0ACB6Q7V2_9PLEO|nr:uncharacterized protein BDR25DRAFT_308219 [Lindgomyces ingoldianus]KAF2462595.1 hypothetical protein BDR25DRAFT_308219 [Lindgomyces ingoldianus]
MDSPVLLRQLLRLPPQFLHIISVPLRPQSRNLALLNHTHPSPSRYISTESLPRVAQPTFWSSLIPRFPRNHSVHSPPKSKQRNPATPYIVLSMLVGSQAIQTLWLKRDMDHFARRAEAKLGVLREVVERVQRGEDVDVEKVLGTGVEGEERAWQEVIKEIEEEELLFQSKKRRRAARQAEAKEEAGGAGSASLEAQKLEAKIPDGKVHVEAYRGAKFY